MKIEPFGLPGLLLITPLKHGDRRGFFSEVFRRDLFEAQAGPVEFVQDNHARSEKKGTLRGMHWQNPPFPQGKLVRVLRGAALDIVVDIRRGSPAYGKHVSVMLSAANWLQLWIPPGFAHGYCTLEDDTEFFYKVTNRYAPDLDAGFAWNDPALRLGWPLPEAVLTLSAKDRALPLLSTADAPFTFGEDQAR